jgi:hypothetical protein
VSDAVDTMLLVVPTDAGWEVVDAFGHRPPAVFADKEAAVDWSADEAYRDWGRVVVCDDGYGIEGDYSWEPPDR